MSLYKGTTLISGAIPNSANQSLSNLDSAGQDKFDAKVNKSGDTMTGALSITSTYPRIMQGQTNLTKGTTPSKPFYMGVLFNDKNSNSASHYSETRLGIIEHQSLSDGTERILIAPYRNVANSTDTAQFSISIPKSGAGYCDFPDTTCCDGQWIKTDQTIMNDVNIKGTTVLTYTLSLPNDGRNYEVLLSGNIVTGSALGNALVLQVSSSIVGSTIICWTTNRGTNTSAMRSGGNVIIPVSSNHTIYVTRANDYTGTASLYMRAYRRIGTNA